MRRPTTRAPGKWLGSVVELKLECILKLHPMRFGYGCGFGVPVQPGNSGGALVDERGNVVGVVSAKLNESTANYTKYAKVKKKRGLSFLILRSRVWRISRFHWQ